MPPACVHFKNRMPSATGTCNEEMPPAPKRARESLSASSVLTDPRVRVGKSIPPESDEKKATWGNSPPYEKSSSRSQAPDAEYSPPRGKYNISDPKALECPICFNALSLPVYQCKNGHIICPSCRSNMEKTKRSCCCGETTWDIRCYGIEAILATLSVRCINAVYGCHDFTDFLKRKEHEEVLCRYRPYDCAVDGCNYRGPKPALLQHFDKVHQMQAVQVDTRSRIANFSMKCIEKYKLVQSDQELYVVYHEPMAGTPRGDVFYCASFGPYKRHYQLKVELRSESRNQAMWSATPEIKALEEWKLRRNYLSILEGVQVQPRTNCQYDIELHLFSSVDQHPVN